METCNHIQIAGPFERVFKLAADIARWPKLLPHYRWVKVLDRNGNRATVEMAARHKGLPVWWKSIQTVSQEDGWIHYTHIGGITRGMEVDWIFTKGDSPEMWHVEIRHDFDPGWPLFGPWVAKQVIGKMFVEQIAGKTLDGLRQFMEREAITI